MAYKISDVEIWAADIPNQPGTLARLLEPISNAGCELEFLIARAVDENISRVFLAPIKGAKHKQAAQEAGLAPAQRLHSFRIEGPDRRGLGHAIARAIAEHGVNLRGVSAAGTGGRAVVYLAIDNPEAKDDAKKVVKQLLAEKKRPKKAAKKRKPPK